VFVGLHDDVDTKFSLTRISSSTISYYISIEDPSVLTGTLSPIDQNIQALQLICLIAPLRPSHQWPTPPHFTYSALAWLASENKAAFAVFSIVKPQSADWLDGLTLSRQAAGLAWLDSWLSR